MTSPPPVVARFEKPIAALAAILSPDALAPDRIEGAIDEVVKRDARGGLFALEGLLRLYRAIEDGRFGELHERVKGLEDAIGAYTEKVEYLTFATKRITAPPAAVATLEADGAAARARLAALLPGVPPLLERLLATVRATPWPAEEDDARRLVRAIGRELAGISRDRYDLHELQAGIHELRRDLRWFLVYVQALDGLIIPVRARPLRLNCYSFLETHPLAASRFSQVPPNPALRWTTSVPFAYFLALSKIVNELGDVKSFGENVEALASALQRSGVASGEAHAQAHALTHALPDAVPDVPRAASRILQELRETRLLRRIRRHLIEGLHAVDGG